LTIAEVRAALVDHEERKIKKKNTKKGKQIKGKKKKKKLEKIAKIVYVSVGYTMLDS